MTTYPRTTTMPHRASRGSCQIHKFRAEPLCCGALLSAFLSQVVMPETAVFQSSSRRLLRFLASSFSPLFFLWVQFPFTFACTLTCFKKRVREECRKCVGLNGGKKKKRKTTLADRCEHGTAAALPRVLNSSIFFPSLPLLLCFPNPSPAPSFLFSTMRTHWFSLSSRACVCRHVRGCVAAWSRFCFIFIFIFLGVCALH